ncbi:MAG: glycosyltransferase family 2 protein [Eggerthellaceae bacterium]|nr:glycosyltransferase family 2 protein [Eggerthellaceae bacterium]
MPSNITFVDIFNIVILVTFTICYSYQIVYIITVFVKKPPNLVAKKNHKYAVICSARNEEAVIGDLIRSIQNQNYPQELLDIYIIADNCTDGTATVTKDAGANVFVRNNTKKIGKGYALTFCFRKLFKLDRGYEAYFVFDADNVLDANYFKEMNKVFDNGAMASTCYRNSKNFGSNWVSSGYGLWFLREAKFINQARITFKTGCAISGTGYFVSDELLRSRNGWRWHLLTEDIQFSADCACRGVRISYSPDAVIYDEQPFSVKDSWNQRFRWSKGFYQVFWKYGWKLFKGMFTNPKGKKFVCFDMLMTILPGMLVSMIAFLFNLIVFVLCISGVIPAEDFIFTCFFSGLWCIVYFFVIMFIFGVVTMLSENKNIHMSRMKKVICVFTFPLFMGLYIPISLSALFRKGNWKPIRHTISVDVNEFSNVTESNGKDNDIAKYNKKNK